ncbi:MAG TPA: DUF1904 family protein [Spirochaetia bacterium]|nr:DUF1904 family protein [Spirochaetales bacterium]HRY71944.1 DUF1904 family protein [Spirochaetia bacterium]
MPHIRARNVDPALLEARARVLVDRLQEAVGCDRAWFTLELEASRAIDSGSGEPVRPYVEVHWFPRPPEAKKAVARILSEELRGGADYLTTVFFDLAEADYFENGEPV